MGIEILTYKQAASELGRSYRSITSLVAQKKLIKQERKNDRVGYITRTEIERFKIEGSANA
jgi:hypothetical protein